MTANDSGCWSLGRRGRSPGLPNGGRTPLREQVTKHSPHGLEGSRRALTASRFCGLK